MTKSTSSGVNIFGVLGIVFVVLKLTKNIDWSWWWVTVPFWGGLALLAVIGIGWLIVLLIGLVLDYFRSKREIME